MEIGLNWTGKAAKWIFLDVKIDDKFVEKMMTFLKILYYIINIKKEKIQKSSWFAVLPELIQFNWFQNVLTRPSLKFCRNKGPPYSTQIEGFYIVILIPCHIWVLWGK